MRGSSQLLRSPNSYLSEAGSHEDGYSSTQERQRIERFGRPSALGDAAVKKMIAQGITVARAKNRKIGICGEAPSDYPEFAQFLAEQKIDSISLNPDTVLQTTIAISEKESSQTS
jgi:phosphoenolpyruvate synthase/pyruvate phosphate dikinase